MSTLWSIGFEYPLETKQLLTGWSNILVADFPDTGQLGVLSIRSINGVSGVTGRPESGGGGMRAWM